MSLPKLDSPVHVLTIRSPWSNEYLPSSTSGPVPSTKLRQLEISLNSAFDTYREMYFEGGISSVYLWDIDEDTSSGKEMAFAGAVVLKKGKLKEKYQLKQQCYRLNRMSRVKRQYLPVRGTRYMFSNVKKEGDRQSTSLPRR